MLGAVGFGYKEENIILYGRGGRPQCGHVYLLLELLTHAGLHLKIPVCAERQVGWVVCAETVN